MRTLFGWKSCLGAGLLALALGLGTPQEAAAQIGFSIGGPRGGFSFYSNPYGYNNFYGNRGFYGNRYGFNRNYYGSPYYGYNRGYNYPRNVYRNYNYYYGNRGYYNYPYRNYGRNYRW